MEPEVSNNKYTGSRLIVCFEIELAIRPAVTVIQLSALNKMV